MTIEQKLKTLMEGTDPKKDVDAPEDKNVDNTPAVTNDNPIDPIIDSADVDSIDQGSGEPVVPPVDPATDPTAIGQGSLNPDTDQTDEKKPVKESLDALLGTEFSEDFRIKATAIFEAALKDNTEKMRLVLEEEFNAKKLALDEALEDEKLKFEEALKTEVGRLDEETSEKIDGYLDYLSEEWVQKNELAIESGIKAELTESFIDGMKGLFEQHFVDLPDTKVDLVNQLTEKNVALEEEISKSVLAASEAKQKYDAIVREKIITESAKDFTALDGERFKRLVEDFDYVSEETFRKKVDVVKASFFEAKESTKKQLNEEFTRTKKVVAAQTIVEEKILDVLNEDQQSTSTMSTYLKYLSK